MTFIVMSVKYHRFIRNLSTKQLTGKIKKLINGELLSFGGDEVYSLLKHLTYLKDLAYLKFDGLVICPHYI
ncbi:hypothetical protein UB34_14650 [Photobacterium leiognathi]|uniref:Uncharacterized protein n=1 Tax=Photobacterium leiognathi TaxID=553611 RepID=A0A2T3M7F5_PHOLE|nr:hypothetical protein UB34_14650 [Photobacterium leiognathi]PSV88141.1 hypothetical protein CTM89_15305 [Photobacterium leiognathi]